MNREFDKKTDCDLYLEGNCNYQDFVSIGEKYYVSRKNIKDFKPDKHYFGRDNTKDLKIESGKTKLILRVFRGKGIITGIEIEENSIKR